MSTPCRSVADRSPRTIDGFTALLEKLCGCATHPASVIVGASQAQADERALGGRLALGPFSRALTPVRPAPTSTRRGRGGPSGNDAVVAAEQAAKGRGAITAILEQDLDSATALCPNVAVATTAAWRLTAPRAGRDAVTPSPSSTRTATRATANATLQGGYQARSGTRGQSNSGLEPTCEGSGRDDTPSGNVDRQVGHPDQRRRPSTPQKLYCSSIRVSTVLPYCRSFTSWNLLPPESWCGYT